MIPVFKEKGNVQERGNYRGINLLSHTLKIWDRVVGTRLRMEVEVSSGQFGFIPGRGTTNPIFILRQRAEKYSDTKSYI